MTGYRFEPIAWRRAAFDNNRTLADDLRDNPSPVDATPHVHFHAHGGTRHSHEHVHFQAYGGTRHAHSSRQDAPAHEVVA